ncbi:MAG: 4'-phosphopantetheinyl transferase superfamily protein [Actinomycetota bacterium]|nr:4'-phosphopantetheinyl transferase superfamily protein [Actinomycetota bacterium]
MSPAPLVLAGSTAAINHRLGDPASFLSGDELRRAARFRSSCDRADFIAAHALVRVAAGMLLGTSGHELTLVQKCYSCGGNHGRPSIAESAATQVSMSHAPGVVAAAAGFRPVAVDVDTRRRQVVDAAVATMVLHPSERKVVEDATDPELAFLRFWVRKESLVKLGRLSLDSLVSIDLSAVPVETTWLGQETCRLTWEGWHLLEWSHSESQVVGSAIAASPPRFIHGAD